MTEKNNTALRILTTTLAGGFGGWLYRGDLEHFVVGAVTGFIWGVVMPFVLPHLKSGWVWFVEQFERF
jgi:hypothetical protein